MKDLLVLGLNPRDIEEGQGETIKEGPLLWSPFHDDGRLERLFLQYECCKRKILFGLESEDGCTCRIGLFLFGVLGHGGVRKLDFDDQLVAMFLEMEHGEVDNVDFFGALEQELVIGRRDIVSLSANLVESAPIGSET